MRAYFSVMGIGANRRRKEVAEMYLGFAAAMFILGIGGVIAAYRRNSRLGIIIFLLPAAVGFVYLLAGIWLMGTIE